MWTPSPLPGTQSGLSCRMQFLCGKKNVKSLFSSPDYDFANQIRLGTKAWEGALENVDFASGWAEQSGKFWSCACSGMVERGEKGRPDGSWPLNGNCGRKTCRRLRSSAFQPCLGSTSLESLKCSGERVINIQIPVTNKNEKWGHPVC